MARSRQTAPSLVLAGNSLFQLAVASIGFHEALAARLLADVLATIGSSPGTAAIEELGLLLPEIERRLLLLVPYDLATTSLGRLRRLLLSAAV
jgi:hypothetical protein